MVFGNDVDSDNILLSFDGNADNMSVDVTGFAVVVLSNSTASFYYMWVPVTAKIL